MKPLLDSHACVKEKFYVVDEVHHPDKKVRFRIFLCTCVFVSSILALLYCINWDSRGVRTAQTAALHGLGTVFMKGSMGMDDLVVAHVAENTSMQELKLFMRTFYRSGLAARADMVLIFSSDILSVAMESTILEETAHFCRLLSQEKPIIAPYTYDGKRLIFPPFNKSMYVKPIPSKASIWGCHPDGSSQSNAKIVLDACSTKLAVGSVVSFSMSELNAENGFEDFIKTPPLQLRRWACYQLLLGMVKHEFKHVLLTGVRGVIIIDDPLVSVRTKVGLYLSFADVLWGPSPKASGDHGNVELGLFEEMKQFNHSIIGPNGAAQSHLHDAMTLPMLPTVVSDGSKILKEEHKQKTVRRLRKRQKARGPGQQGAGLYEQVYGRMMWSALDDAKKNKKLINSATIMGGIQHILALADAMVVEIVRVAMPLRRRTAFPDSVLLSHLVHVHKSSIGLLSKKVAEDDLQVFENSESFVHTLTGSQQRSFFKGQSGHPYAMISEGHHHGHSLLWSYVVVMLHHSLCMSSSDGDVYGNCGH